MVAMRSMYRGVIQFGLVACPVKLYLGLDQHSSGAHLIHDPCKGRIQQRTWCPTCDAEAPRSELVKGFEVSPGIHVIVRDEEFESLPVRTLHTIDVQQFIELTDAARLEIWSRQPYYLAPEDLGRRPFALLCAALEDSGLAGIAKITIREREHVATIRPLENGLLLTTLAWPEEVRPIGHLDLPSHAEVPATELALARELVRAMARPFDASEYRDEYGAALRQLIESKVEGESFRLPEPEPSATLVDLMTALQASVAEAVAARADSTSGVAARSPSRSRRRKAVADAA